MKGEYAAAGALGMMFLAAVGVTIHTSHWAFTTIDTRRVCAAGHRNCLDRSPAIVVDSDTVREETGVSDVEVPVDLERGERVFLESWNNRLVSIFDRASGRRMHTSGWPSRMHDDDFDAALGVSFFLGALVAASGMAAYADRARG